MGCPFCERIHEDDVEVTHHEPEFDVVSFEPLNPVTEGHRLFVPYDHIERDPAALGVCARVAAEFAANWYPRLYADFNVIVNQGPAASQTVQHLHVHLVPRHADDGLTLPWTGQVRG